jgi:hypothetical protein
MLPSLTAALAYRLDLLHPPGPHDASAHLFKEWHHFVLLAPEGDAMVLANLALHGNVQTDEGRATSLLAGFVGASTFGHARTYTSDHAVFDSESPDLRLPNAVLTVDPAGLYHLRANGGSSISLVARLRIDGTPFALWNDTPLGPAAGSLNWTIVPAHVEHGCLRRADDVVLLDGWDAYHDHNWGRWAWGDNFSWCWVYSGTRLPDGRSVALSLSRSADRSGRHPGHRLVAVWLGGRLARVFTDASVWIEMSDGIDASDAPCVPAIARPLIAARRPKIPRTVSIRTVAGADHLSAEVRSDRVMHIAIPRDGRQGFVVASEAAGTFSARGVLGSERIDVKGFGCLEALA